MKDIRPINFLAKLARKYPGFRLWPAADPLRNAPRFYRRNAGENDSGTEKPELVSENSASVFSMFIAQV